jgi:DNA-binding helix-hairpin-helix protein with protein kinase domain
MTDLKTGDSVFMRSASDPLRVGERLGRGGQGTVFGTEMNGRQLAIKWYRPSPSRLFDQKVQASLITLVAGGRPKNPAFIWPIDMVACPGRDGFGYVMPRMESRFITCFQMLSATDPPNFQTKIRIGLNLVDAFASLHTDGLCYRDISFGNLYVDPGTGDVAIIDNDNVGTNGGEALIKGTPQFMAPEVMLDEATPSAESDLYSLALFLFYLFCHGHPLDGIAVERSYNSDERERLSDYDLLLKHFGRVPVFIFDPTNSSNRPIPDHPVSNWWQVYPRFFQELFTRSFTTGLRDATLTGRFAEGMWRKALHRLSDCVWQCQTCHAGLLFDARDIDRACWHCGRTPAPPLLLTAPGYSLVIADGAVLTSRHLMLPGPPNQTIGTAELDERFRGSVLLRNVTSEPWDMEASGEEPKQVRPGQRLLARPGRVRVGGKWASIVRSGEQVAG